MNVVQYSPYFLAAETGSGNSMRGWCEALSRQGMSVKVLVDPKQVSRTAPSGVSWQPIEHRFTGRMCIPAGLRKHLASADLLVVHGGWTLWNIVACRQAAAAGVPYLVTTHGVYNPWVLDKGTTAKRIWNVLLERRHLRRALALHLFFEEERKGLERLGLSVQAVVSPNGISVPEDVRWDGGSGGYLLWLGRFDTRVKGLDLLIRSLLEFPVADRPTLRLHGPDVGQGKTLMARLARDLGLEGSVIIGDPIYGEEKWRTIAGATAYVQPSRWDTSPMAVGEAVGAGVPTLVANYPLGRLLASEGAALMCERTPDEIAKGIRRLISEEGAEIGRRGTEVARGTLSWDAVARSWREQVEGFLKARAGRR